ncbi:MAG: response regulator transcription factor [Reichenbachiella sp.]
MQTQSVIIADHHFISQEGLAKIVNGQQDLNLLHTVDKPSALKQYLDNDPARLLVINLSNHPNEYLELLESISPQIGILALIDVQNKKAVKALWTLGIKGIVTDKCSKEEITNALNQVAIGKKFYCNKILETINESDQSLSEQFGLTSREVEVIQLIVKGLSTTDIANQLYVSKHTINSHRKNILKKLNLKSPVELIVFAIEHNMN